LTFCDAAGIRILIRGDARARARDGWLRLAHVDRRVRRVLAITKLTGVLRAFDSVGEAVAEMPAAPGQSVAQPSGKRLKLPGEGDDALRGAA
jgi:anti-anti-sigma regulatory factor